MDQPVPRYTDAVPDRVIDREFPQEAFTEVRGLLARYGHVPWAREVLRVQMACFKCANGNLIPDIKSKQNTEGLVRMLENMWAKGT